MSGTGPVSPTGLMVIDKPMRVTSMHVCRVVRAKLVRAGAPKRVKVGHGGTLDPLATGVLVVLVGRATPLCDAVMAGEKEYEAEVDLTISSSTDDLEGELTSISVLRAPDLDEVRRACGALVGRVMQTPPAFSAVKVGGRRAYDLARAGRAPEMSPRPVEVHEIVIEAYAFPVVRLRVRCGKGVYIRSLARDLGRALTGAGCLRSLRRTRVGRWTLEGARRLDELPESLSQEDLLPIPSDLSATGPGRS